MATVSINHRTDPRTRRAAAKARPRQGLPRAPVSYPAMILDLMLSSDAKSKIINQRPVRPCGQETVTARLVSAIRGSAAAWLHWPRRRRVELQLRHAWPDRVP